MNFGEKPKIVGKKIIWKPGVKDDLFYFDDVACVDTKSSKDIPDVRCDGKQTANELFDKLVEYFKLNEK